VKLVDFGLAAHADGSDRITRQGTLVGTPHYMAPEAAEGDTVSPSGDVYSLAVIAFELLTGGLPHEGQSALEIMSAKLTTPPRTLAERSGKMFTLSLERAFDVALHCDPAQRPKTASELVGRLAASIRS
jgi:serine/threonine protein kinase